VQRAQIRRSGELDPKIAGEHHVDPLEEEEAHLLGEPWKPRRRLRRRHSWADDQIEEGTGI
jgi:hypothetical protein